jgi:hypothetical protein
LEPSAGSALVRFRDGDAYLVRVISTMHAEAGDDIVAEVLQCVAASGDSTIPAGAFMNFLLADVAEVSVGSERAFARPPDAEPDGLSSSGLS